MPPYVTSRGTRCFSTSPLLRALPPAIQESTLFHDVMSQSFKDARMHLEPKSDETFMGDYWVLKKDGSVSKGPTGLLKKELCRHFSLSPRDLRLLDGRAPMTFSPTVLVRENSVCYASSVLRAVITPQAIHIISATFDRHYQEDDSRLSAEEICQSLKTTMGLGLRELLASSNHSPQQCDEVLPFELRALEAILYRITSGYARVFQRLHDETIAIFESLNHRESRDNASHEDIRIVADARRALDDFTARARSLQTSVSKLLREDDSDLAGLYLTAKMVNHQPRSTEDHEEAELMLEGILRRQDEIVASAELLMTDIISAQKLMELGMAATRNRLLHLEIKLDIAMLAVSVSASCFAAFGMNLVSGLEEVAGVFWVTTGLCFMGSAVMLRSGFKALAVASKRRYLSQIISGQRKRRSPVEGC